MNESKISVRYAKALFDLSGEKKLLDKVYGDMGLVFSVMEENPELTAVLEHPVIRISKKKEVVREIFRGAVQEITLQFLELIIHNKREGFIQMIARRFLMLYKKEKGITEVLLTTAVPFTEEMKERLKSMVAKVYTSTVELRDVQKPEIIGGFILRVNDEQLDASTASELKRIQRQLSAQTL